MKNMSTTVRSNDSNNLTTISSPAHMDFPSRAEEIVCSTLLFEALLIFTGNLVAIVFFALEKELRKRKSLFLVINMAFADVMLGALSVPLFVYLKVGFQLWSITQEVGVVLDYFYLHFDIIFLQASLISAVLYILWKILRRLSATKTPYIVNKGIRHCYKCNLDTCYCCQRDIVYSYKLNFSHSSLLSFCNIIFDFFIHHMCL